MHNLYLEHELMDCDVIVCSEVVRIHAIGAQGGAAHAGNEVVGQWVPTQCSYVKAVNAPACADMYSVNRKLKAILAEFFTAEPLTLPLIEHASDFLTLEKDRNTSFFTSWGIFKLPRVGLAYLYLSFISNM